MRKIKRDSVSALIFTKDGKLFQGMKDPAKGGVYADCWHIPGGGIDEGEDKRTALIREIQEETGIAYRHTKSSSLTTPVAANAKNGQRTRVRTFFAI